MPARMFHRFARAVALLALTCTAALAQNTIHIPTDQPTIQAGINAANNGDTVLVAPGTYYENIDFGGRAITVISASGAANTIIDGRLLDSVVTIGKTGGPSATLDGFTIQHASSSLEYHCAVHVLGDAVVQNNIIINNKVCGIGLHGGTVLVRENTISSNDPGIISGFDALSAPGISENGFFTTNTWLTKTIIDSNNIQSNDGHGIALTDQTDTVISNNTISRNHGDGITLSDVAATLSQNLISLSYGTGVFLEGGLINLYSNTITANGQRLQSTYNASEVSMSLGDDVSAVNNLIVGLGVYPAFTCNNILGDGSYFDHNDILSLQPIPNNTPPQCDFGLGTLGNIAADPHFVDISGGNFHVQAGSPVIDTGNNNGPAITAFDLDRNVRIQDGSGKGIPIIDMGAFEFAPQSTRMPVTATLVASPNQVAFGSLVTLMAIVTPSSAAGVPTGTITFYDGTTQLGIINLTPTATYASATFTSATFTPGQHNFICQYSGDTTFDPAACGTASVAVSLASSTLTLTTMPSTGYVITPITLTATVTSTASGGATPTGNVTFTVNGVPLTTTPLVNGVATLATTGLPLGTDQIIANYLGDSSYAPTTSNTATVTITAAPTTLTLAPSINPSPALSPVTFTAQLLSGATPVPGATVVFFLGLPSSPSSAQLEATTTTNAQGIATFVFPGTYPGSLSFFAYYAGGAAYLTSTSAALAETFIFNPTTITLTATPNPAEQNAAVTLSVNVLATIGSAPPTGSVTIFDGATPLGSIPELSSTSPTGTNLSTGSLQISTLSPGTHTLTAAFTPFIHPRVVAPAFLASQTTSSVSLIILPQSFTLTLSDTTLTLQTGHHHAVTVSLTSIGGLTGAFTQTCGTRPEYTTCGWGQSSVTLPANGTVATSLIIDTDQYPGFLSSNLRPTTNQPSWRHELAATTALALLPFTLLGFRRRRNLRSLLSLLILATLATALTACGANHYPGSTPPGTYTIPITATGQPTGSSTALTQTVNLTLIVTP